MSIAVERSFAESRRLSATLWRHRYAAALITILLLALLHLRISELDRVYTSTAIIMLEQPGSGVLEQGAGQGDTDPGIVRAEVTVLNSTAVAARAVRNLDLLALSEFAPDLEAHSRRG